ncbi:MAG: hypothetical protein WCO56_29480, partial [Verrucomicrobiota bacterium]
LFKNLQKIRIVKSDRLLGMDNYGLTVFLNAPLVRFFVGQLIIMTPTIPKTLPTVNCKTTWRKVPALIWHPFRMRRTF